MNQKFSHYKTLSIVERKVKDLVFDLTDLLKNWDVDEDKREKNTPIGDLKPIKPSDKKDLTIILTTKINFVNIINYDQFVY